MDSGMSRRLLLMVETLHDRGLQRLRIVPGLSPSGCYWRCGVTPASNISRHHGAYAVDHEHLFAAHSSGYEGHCFRWEDGPGMDHMQMAAAFIDRFERIACEGRGEDGEYVAWFKEMLRLTTPDDLPVAFHDWGWYPDRLETVGGHRTRLPLPPGGEHPGGPDALSLDAASRA